MMENLERIEKYINNATICDLHIFLSMQYTVVIFKNYTVKCLAQHIFSVTIL